MKIPALSAILLVGSLSVVAAAPADNESTERVSYTKQASHERGTPDDNWVELASPTPASHGREFITVDGGHYSRLRIDAARGRPIVRSVRISYRNGKTEVVRVDTVLGTRRNPTAFVSLRKHGEIDQIVVVTEGDAHGSYTVAGEPAHTGVATR